MSLNKFTENLQGYRHAGVMAFAFVAGLAETWAGVDLNSLSVIELLQSNEAMKTLALVGFGGLLSYFKQTAEMREPPESGQTFDEQIDQAVREARGDVT